MIPSTCMTHAHCCVALGLEFKLPIRSLGKIIQQFVKRIARVTSILNKISVAYHKAIKKILGMNVWESNHLACERLGVNLFRHLQAKRMFNYYRSVLKSKNGVLIKSKYYWQFYSDIRINIERIFKCDYDVDDVFDNFDDAILSRVDFVERNEPRSSYLNVLF